jgi:hypothetical protein
MPENLYKPIKPGDAVVTTLGRHVVVGAVHKDEDGIWIEPEGADDTTWWIPVWNIVSVNGQAMAWKPASEADLLTWIEIAEYSMDPAPLAFWSRIRVRPVKWQLPPWGDLGGGFWVVAVFGQECVWFNDIEDGFNISRFADFGTIGDYVCNQSDLRDCIHSYFESFAREIGMSN